MARKKATIDKPVKKEVAQRLVRRDNIDKRLKAGWKLVTEKVTDDRGRVLGVKTNASDLVLMEKEK